MVGKLCAAAVWLGLATTTLLAAEQPPPFEIPPGFEATRFSGDDLAANITAMTFDTQGRVVVAGPGYIKTLIDDERDGRADRETTLFDGRMNGVAGLVCMNEGLSSSLICTTNSGLLMFHDAENDGVADGMPVRLLSIETPAEFGMHGIARGPDGDFYIACGNASKLEAFTSRIGHRSPIRLPRGGGVLHFSLRTKSPDGAPLVEVVADGLRNPYDVDFTTEGLLLALDGDNEADLGLPWYSPVRLLDVGEGNRFGWITSGVEHGWNRPPYFFDVAPAVAEFGRGAPTGFVVYRHRQFPEHYRGGAFTADWLKGRVDFLALRSAGSSCTADREPFLATVGDSGLAPVDLAVGPDGDLYIACGGRGLPGGVYRVRYVGEGETPLAPSPPQLADDATDADKLQFVLRADQPLAAWSRARWKPIAEALKRESFAKVIADPNAETADQVRAVEVYLEVFGRLPSELAMKAIALKRPPLSARAAWAIDCPPYPFGNWRDPLVGLTHDADPRVQRAAWETLHYHPDDVNASNRLLPNWAALDDPALDGRVRRLMESALLHPPQPPSLANQPAKAEVETQRQALERHRTTLDAVAWLQRFQDFPGRNSRLRALRSLQIAFGDFQADPRIQEVYAGYRPNQQSARAGDGPELFGTPLFVRNELAAAFPTGDAAVDRELARTAGMFSQANTEFLAKVSAGWTDTSDPVDDVHYLIAASLIDGERSRQFTQRSADALLRLDEKHAARKQPVERNWSLRIGEVFERMQVVDPDLTEAILDAPTFGRPAHAMFVVRMPEGLRVAAAKKLVAEVAGGNWRGMAWNRELIEVAGMSNDPRALEWVRGLWKEQPGLRSAIFPLLVQANSPTDRERFVECLTHADPDIVMRAAVVLRRLVPATPEDRELASTVRGLRQMCTIAEATRARDELLTLIGIWGGEWFDIREPTALMQQHNATALRDAYQPVFLRFQLSHYQAAIAAASPRAVDPVHWKARLLTVDWSRGDVARGRAIFERKQCVRCHEGGGKLGPDLDGVADRYSRSELFATVFEPSRFVPALYRPTNAETNDGRVYTGIVIHDSADTILLQSRVDAAFRIAGGDVVDRHESTESIMPTGLLNDFESRDFADLYAYLKQLKRRSTAPD